MDEELISFIRKTFNEPEGVIALHEPLFVGNEREYVLDAIDSTFVSSVGQYVDRFEKMITQSVGCDYAIATVNGTAALHLALVIAGVQRNDEVLTQALTFVATPNAICHAGAEPVFIDVDKDTMGLSPTSLRAFLEEYAELRDNACYNKKTNRRISACVPMHTFGFALRIEEVVDVCDEYNIPVVEDSTEALGAYCKERHLGTFGLLGVFSFNGNKMITSGGGGVIVTDDETLAKKAKHASTTAKLSHPWEYEHDMVAYNYRMPNLNAALACAQLEQLPMYLIKKRHLAELYKDFFKNTDIEFISELENTRANCWLNTILLGGLEERNDLLSKTNQLGIMTRPAWKLMNKLEMYSFCQRDSLQNSDWLANRIVNLPSSVIMK